MGKSNFFDLNIASLQNKVSNNWRILDALYIRVANINLTGPNNIILPATGEYSASVVPSDALFKEFAFSIIPYNGAASIDQSGILTPIAPGKVVVKVSCLDDPSVFDIISLFIGVEPPVSNVLYGRYYNAYACWDSRYIAPIGCRIAKTADFDHIRDLPFLTGGNLKSTRTAPDAHPRWDSPNTGADDNYGFSALPAGLRSGGGSFPLPLGQRSAFYDHGEIQFYFLNSDGSFYRSDASSAINTGSSVRLIVEMDPDLWYPGQTITDIDGNIYNTVRIGNLIWTAQNLATTKFRNGDPIPNVTDDAIWSSTNDPAYCDFDNNPANSIEP